MGPLGRPARSPRTAPSHLAVRHGHARSRGNGADSRKHHSTPDPSLPRSAVGRQSARGSSGAFFRGVEGSESSGGDRGCVPNLARRRVFTGENVAPVCRFRPATLLPPCAVCSASLRAVAADRAKRSDAEPGAGRLCPEALGKERRKGQNQKGKKAQRRSCRFSVATHGASALAARIPSACWRIAVRAPSSRRARLRTCIAMRWFCRSSASCRSRKSQ
jgi:hypothetical protein